MAFFYLAWAAVIWMILALAGCAPPNTGMPEDSYAYLPTNSIMCERKGAVEDFIDAVLEGKDGMVVVMRERRRLPGGSNYTVPTCHVTSTPQRIIRMWGEPEHYREAVHLRKVRLRGSIVNYWVIQNLIEWR